MNFRKSSEGGEGVISNPKIYIAKIGSLNRTFQHENDTKGSFRGMFFNQLPCSTVLDESHGNRII